MLRKQLLAVSYQPIINTSLLRLKEGTLAVTFNSLSISKVAFRDLQLNKVPIMSTEKSLCLSLRGGGIRLNINRKEST